MIKEYVARSLDDLNIYISDKKIRKNNIFTVKKERLLERYYYTVTYWEDTE